MTNERTLQNIYIDMVASSWSRHLVMVVCCPGAYFLGTYCHGGMLSWGLNLQHHFLAVFCLQQMYKVIATSVCGHKQMSGLLTVRGKGWIFGDIVLLSVELHSVPAFLILFSGSRNVSDLTQT